VAARSADVAVAGGGLHEESQNAMVMSAGGASYKAITDIKEFEMSK
jgi:hypothetical protein